MRFGIFIPQGWRLDLAGIAPEEQWPTMKRLAQAADNSQFDSLWVYDHFHTVPVPTEEATHEAWTLMSAFGAATERIKLGQMCTCIGYRNPVYLAKVAATVDHVSGGRVQMGIGAGWYEHEWRAYGYGFPTAGQRLAMLDEGVQIMKQAWTTGSASLDGKQYQVDGAIVRPLPLQEGGIPIWVAGGGETKTLRIAAQYANYTNFDGTPDAFRRKSQVLAEHCAAVGRDFAEITRSSNYNVVIGETEKDVADNLDRIDDHFRSRVPTAEFERYSKMYRSGPLVGTPEQIVEKLKGFEAMGMAYAICNIFETAFDYSTTQLFADEVIPALAG